MCEYHKYLIFKTIKYRIHIIGGPRRMRIQKYVWEKFNEARENGLPVKDQTLRDWAHEINKQVSCFVKYSMKS